MFLTRTVQYIWGENRFGHFVDGHNFVDGGSE